MKTYKIFILCFLAICQISCRQEKVTTFYSDYEIQSIRLDDDSEYHILAVNSKGIVEQLNDCDNGYDIFVSYQNVNKPVLRFEVSDDGYGEGNFVRSRGTGFPQVILPINYKIETFDD